MVRIRYYMYPNIIYQTVSTQEDILYFTDNSLPLSSIKTNEHSKHTHFTFKAR